ncbi:hypothetical protein JDV02_008876 [Purpureocillium takamizusanense]|uniref:Right handed beta helix domain-containing protein n=1 Tax=Purpureocillium takamizusanense TaxID=2060973 RepID=A0A9Q8QNR7_9HYPO|nr:uncharacterized protein JDV02_008876 [Purpureocillium takamizusanense]UNI23033.1 hypothetical protein JDV02_008876 [Purpureocillium takamizusanense]
MKASLVQVALLAALSAAEPGSNYYIDCSAAAAGNGTFEGPWNSLEAANRFTFRPGDTLALKSNVTCTGTLRPLGSGNATHPIRLTSYPPDSILGPPVINGNGANSSLLLTNQDHWRVSKLALTNPAASLGRRQGILVMADDGAAHFGITIDRNHVYDVAGQTNKANFSGDFANSAGIELGALNGSTYVDVWIRDNSVNDCGGGGIKVRPGQMDVNGRNIRVSHNAIDACGGDGILVSYADAPSIDHNVASNLGKGRYPWTGGNFAGMWVMASHDPVMRHNVVYGSVMSLFDSQAFDCDWGVSGTCLVEYNYSHDNAGGAFLDCDGCGVSRGAKQVVRYNVFENDCRIVSVGENASLDFYNNVMYCAEGDFDMRVPQVTRFANNIFVGRSNASLPVASGITWDNNLFETVMPPTEDGIVGDPGFLKPRASGGTLGAAFGYRLREGSPALGSGKVIEDNGGYDYFGNAVEANARPNIGPYNGKGVA